MIVNKIEVKNKDNCTAIIVHYGENEAVNIAWPNGIHLNNLSEILIRFANLLNIRNKNG